MDGHTTMMHWLLVAFNPWSWIYLVAIILLGGFFAFNLVIAVLKTNYGVIANKYKNEMIVDEEA